MSAQLLHHQVVPSSNPSNHRIQRTTRSRLSPIMTLEGTERWTTFRMRLLWSFRKPVQKVYQILRTEFESNDRGHVRQTKSNEPRAQSSSFKAIHQAPNIRRWLIYGHDVKVYNNQVQCFGQKQDSNSFPPHHNSLSVPTGLSHMPPFDSKNKARH